jgi:tetratricopeptide (TPR) repeat protein
VALVWLLYEGELMTKIALSILVAILSVNIVVILARIIALGSYQEVLLLLYEKLDAEAFLKEALPMLEMRTELSQKVNHAVHIANAYMVQEKLDMAIELLQSQQVPDSAYDLRGLIAANLGTAYLLKEDIRHAKESIDQMKRLSLERKCKTEFKKKSKHIIAYQQICIGILEGDNRAREILEKDYQSTTSLLHKRNVEFFLNKISRRTSTI